MTKLLEAKTYLQSNLRLATSPSIGLVLGSGLAHFAQELKKDPHSQVIPFSKIPHFPISTVEGHKGELIYASLSGAPPILALNGRVHYYEGYSPEQVIFPVRICGLLGIKNLILTNAAGAISDNFAVGHLMAIKDHINLTGTSPLIGLNKHDLGPRFLDMSSAYDPSLIKLAIESSYTAKITMHQGVYAGLSGPCFETPAEIHMLKTIGADAVGMSTVFETIAARHMGIKVLAISCLTNKASGLTKQIISHNEVLENNQKVAAQFCQVLQKIIVGISSLSQS